MSIASGFGNKLHQAWADR